MTKREYLTLEQSASLLDCSVTTVRRLVRRGALTPYTFEGDTRHYLRRADVERLAEPTTIVPGSGERGTGKAEA